MPWNEGIPRNCISFSHFLKTPCWHHPSYHTSTIFVIKKLLCESENLTMWAWIFFNSTMFGQFFKMGTNISSISLIFKALSFLVIDDHVASDFQSENLSSSWGYHGPKVSDSDFKWLYSILTAFNFEPSLRKTQQGIKHFASD